LNRGNDTVLGSHYSRWVADPRVGLDYILGHEEPPRALAEAWEWMRDPLPPAEEGGEWAVLRRRLGLVEGETWARAEALARLDPPTRRRAERLAAAFFAAHNPYLRHIVRRTREFLETTIDPVTNEPYLRPVRVRLFGEGADDAVALRGFLADAYAAAEDFCAEVGRRQGMGLGFLKTVLLRRLGSSVAAGRATAARMLGPEVGPGEEDDDTDIEDAPRGSLYPMTAVEEDLLRRVLLLLEEATEEDPKYRAVERLLLDGADGTGPWLERGCIIFSQYYESARWVAALLSGRLPGEAVALYANAAGSGVYRAGLFTPATREAIKEGVRTGAIRLLVGTDAASEGLNLQAIGTLINVDLPWNPTRLEQRKGRIQRIGQLRDEVYIYNMRYRGSVEDRVHSLLSGRLQAIRDLFGQLPDTLEDVWVDVALRDEQKARERIEGVPAAHPFALRYERVEPVDWESCDRVLHGRDQLGPLLVGW